MAIKDRTYAEIEKALYRNKILNKDAKSSAIEERWSISGNSIIWNREMLGMGHGEPRSYGIIARGRITEKELFAPE